jgi:hypothetical protein
MSQSVTFTALVPGDNQAEIEGKVLTLWRDYLDDPKAELPWSVDYVVSTEPPVNVVLGKEAPKFYAQVVVTHTAVQG